LKQINDRCVLTFKIEVLVDQAEHEHHLRVVQKGDQQLTRVLQETADRLHQPLATKSRDTDAREIKS
jgi:hypothetical protein